MGECNMMVRTMPRDWRAVPGQISVDWARAFFVNTIESTTTTSEEISDAAARLTDVDFVVACGVIDANANKRRASGAALRAVWELPAKVER